MIKPYTKAEIMRLAIGVKPLDPLRVLATYADASNWKQVNAKDENGQPRNYWAWAGPTIVGYEFANHGLPKEDRS